MLQDHVEHRLVTDGGEGSVKNAHALAPVPRGDRDERGHAEHDGHADDAKSGTPTLRRTLPDST
jgi:hypothetical protein